MSDSTNPLHSLGRHLIVDLHGATHIDCEQTLHDAFDEIIEVTGATQLHRHFHRFTPNGVTGVACLAESHISVHTWPDSGFAAFDIYMCGGSQPEWAIPILQHHFNPQRIEKSLLERGRVDGEQRPPTTLIKQ
ncbi:MAG: adenosylmethionine decarboxylase [Gammaproteobacteria bacterium]|jgi:S-adenosylmethionine decarboxylase|nr:adenosylmethionine decarboxylase [Gammaproteobacteria bacterium]MBT7307665.1 adenosylmethionine decarboxylase [Gammaproteobacteria bacterium]